MWVEKLGHQCIAPVLNQTDITCPTSQKLPSCVWHAASADSHDLLASILFLSYHHCLQDRNACPDLSGLVDKLKLLLSWINDHSFCAVGPRGFFVC